MTTKKEKLLQKINPKLLEITPRLSSANNSFIELDSGDDTLQEGAKELMLRFLKKQEMFFNSVSSENGIELSDARYQESYRFCQSISQRLSLPFCNESDFNLGKPGKKLQDLKKELEEKMSEERKKEYQKRILAYREWKNKQNQEENVDDEETCESCEIVVNETNDIVTNGSEYEIICHNDNNDENGNNDNVENIDDDDNDDDDDDGDDGHDDDGDADDDADDEENSSDNPDADDEFTEFIYTNCNKRDFSDTISAISEPKKSELIKSVLESGAKVNDTFNFPQFQIIEPSVNVTAQNLTQPNVGEPGGNENLSNDESNLSPSPYQPSERILCSAPEQSQCTQSLPANLLSPSLKFSLMSDSQSPKSFTDFEFQENSVELQKKVSFSNKTKLFTDSQKAEDAYDLNDAFEFCSGKFPDGTSEKLLVCEMESQMNDPNEKSFQTPIDNKEIIDTDSVKTMKRIITFNESEDENNEVAKPEENEPEETQIISDDEDDFSRKSKPTNRKRGARQTLVFTDDEDESDAASNVFAREPIEHETDSEDERDDQRSVFYDSEENEITNPKEFFEREAELSGSEFSGDEDEKGLDEYDEEAGDADDLDYNQIQSQLGKIHLRKLLDDDSRNVRLLQELFFEDGDLHTEDSFKKFRWRNLAKKLKEEQSMGASCSDRRDDQLQSSDEEAEEDLQARKERLEKALLLEKMKENGEFHFEVDFFEKLCEKLKMKSTKNQLKVETADQSKVEEKKESIGNPTIGCNTFSRNFPRGSFLTRNEELLSRLAKVTAGDNVRAPKNSKNFVFATKSPEKAQSGKMELKRPLEELENARFRKRPKFFSSDSSGTSILDLLG